MQLWTTDCSHVRLLDFISRGQHFRKAHGEILSTGREPPQRTPRIRPGLGELRSVRLHLRYCVESPVFLVRLHFQELQSYSKLVQGVRLRDLRCRRLRDLWLHKAPGPEPRLPTQTSSCYQVPLSSLRPDCEQGSNPHSSCICGIFVSRRQEVFLPLLGMTAEDVLFSVPTQGDPWCRVERSWFVPHELLQSKSCQMKSYTK